MLEVMNGSKANLIEKRISKWKRGRIFFADDFLDIADDGAIRITLSRLCKTGKIHRLAKGVFCQPYIDKKFGLGEITPGPWDIAKAIAKHDHVKILPSGPYAEHALGLSTQVAGNAYFITNGAARTILLNGEGKIVFTHSSRAKDFAYKSELMQLIVAAIRNLGEGKLYEHEKAFLKEHLSHVIESEFAHDIKLAPEWVRRTISEIKDGEWSTVLPNIYH